MSLVRPLTDNCHSWLRHRKHHRRIASLITDNTCYGKPYFISDFILMTSGLFNILNTNCYFFLFQQPKLNIKWLFVNNFLMCTQWDSPCLSKRCSVHILVLWPLCSRWLISRGYPIATMTHWVYIVTTSVSAITRLPMLFLPSGRLLKIPDWTCCYKKPLVRVFIPNFYVLQGCFEFR